MRVSEVIGTIGSRQKLIIEVGDKVIRGFTAYEVYQLFKVKERYLDDIKDAVIIEIERENECIKIIGSRYEQF